MIEADEWTGCYRQYDLVSNLWPLVPRCYFEKRIQREDAERIVALEGYNRLEDVASNSALTPTGKNSISDLILLLTEQSDKQRVHRGGSSIQMQEMDVNSWRAALYRALEENLDILSQWLQTEKTANLSTAEAV